MFHKFTSKRLSAAPTRYKIASKLRNDSTKRRKIAPKRRNVTNLFHFARSACYFESFCCK